MELLLGGKKGRIVSLSLPINCGADRGDHGVLRQLKLVPRGDGSVGLKLDDRVPTIEGENRRRTAVGGIGFDDQDVTRLLYVAGGP